MRKQALTPKTARTFAEICKLKRDNVDMPEGWAMLDEGGVIITNQKSGEPVTGRVHVYRTEASRRSSAGTRLGWSNTPESSPTPEDSDPPSSSEEP
jgi:hypothetical protein